jgi:predicted RecA/RadA family phage recombinase
MKNFVQPGDALTVTAPAVVTAGQIVVVGTNLLGIAATDAASGAPVVIATQGVYRLPADVTAATAAVGQFATHHTTNNTISITAPGAGFVKVGVFAQAKQNGDTTVLVRLNGAY